MILLGQHIVSALWNIKMSVNQGVICTHLYGHAFGTFHFCPDNCEICISGVWYKGFHCISDYKLHTNTRELHIINSRIIVFGVPASTSDETKSAEHTCYGQPQSKSQKA